MTTETRYEHIVIDAQKGPMIADTRIKLSVLISQSLAYAWSPKISKKATRN